MPYTCQDELVKRNLLNEVIRANSSVLEIGGRLGAMSCEIAKIQGNSGMLVVAEANKVTQKLLRLEYKDKWEHFFLSRIFTTSCMPIS